MSKKMKQSTIADNSKSKAYLLFSGTPTFAGLSNERDLARACPPEFKADNPWSHYAGLVFCRGACISNWKWKTDELPARKVQRSCFMALLGGFGLGHEDKEAVAGWMLSEMLAEVPKYMAAAKKGV